MSDTRSKRQSWLICLCLALAVLAAYAPVWSAGFITYDDPAYVTANPVVQSGLSWSGFIWAFTTGHAGNWHPLTWISHMLDFQIYGLNPAGHHLTSIALHAANSILLFLLLQRMTRTTWPSALVAALFALHPLRVESVAWVAERKDVLAGFFFMLTLGAYARYAENLKFQISNFKFYYISSVVLFALGLAAKPMLVTLPFVLLLLDFWPLQRRQVPLAGLVAEKTPWFILSALSCAVTFLVQRHVGAVLSTAQLPFSMRLANVPVACVRYVAKTFWPAHLAIAYPMLKWPAWAVAGAIVLLLLLSALVLWRVRTQPWLAVGWLWFLGMLTPVIGVIQVGMQSMADRYSYLPGIGLLIAIVWTARDWSVRLAPWARAIIGGLAVAICLVLTARQATFWQNDQTLFLHAIQATKGNFVAYAGLGEYEGTHGNTNLAISHLQTSLRIKPNYPNARNILGRILLLEGREDDALQELQKAVSLDPALADARYNLGHALLAKGQVAEALDQFQAQVSLQPGDYKAQNNMGAVLLQNGLAGDAIPYLRRALEIKPADGAAHYLLGNALYRTGGVAEAIRQFELAIQLDLNHIQALSDLAWILACHPDPTFRNGAKAVVLGLRADELSGGQNPVIIGTLAAAYAEAGKFPEAIAADRRACQAALAQTNSALAELLQKRLRLYQAGSPWRDSTEVRIKN
ncbi:MAG: tetratricopeptide repeat protein [Verrucomicrobiota bacterium]|jgi:Flp pilus assembly protein TadD